MTAHFPEVQLTSRLFKMVLIPFASLLLLDTAGAQSSATSRGEATGRALKDMLAISNEVETLRASDNLAEILRVTVQVIAPTGKRAGVYLDDFRNSIYVIPITGLTADNVTREDLQFSSKYPDETKRSLLREYLNNYSMADLQLQVLYRKLWFNYLESYSEFYRVIEPSSTPRPIRTGSMNGADIADVEFLTSQLIELLSRPLIFQDRQTSLIVGIQIADLLKFDFSAKSTLIQAAEDSWLELTTKATGLLEKLVSLSINDGSTQSSLPSSNRSLGLTSGQSSTHASGHPNGPTSKPAGSLSNLPTSSFITSSVIAKSLVMRSRLKFAEQLNLGKANIAYGKK